MNGAIGGYNSQMGGGSFGDTTDIRNKLMGSMGQPSQMGQMYNSIVGGEGNTYIDPMVDAMKRSSMENLDRMNSGTAMDAAAMGQGGSSRHAMQNAMQSRDMNSDMLDREMNMRGGAYDTDLNMKMDIASMADSNRQQEQDRMFNMMSGSDANQQAGMSFGQGMQNGIAEEFKEDAATSIWVWPRRTSIEYNGFNSGRPIQLRNNDHETISERMDVEYEKASMLFFPRDVQVVYNNDLLVYNVAGTNGDLQIIENEFLSEGRYINETDVRQNAKVAIISNKIKREVFSKVETPIGEYITISGAGFKIVGVFGEHGQNEGEEERIFIPITTAQLAFNGSDKLNNLNFMLPEMETFDETVVKNIAFTDDVLAYLKKAHGVAPEDDRAIHIWNPIQEAKRFYSLGLGIEIFFWAVGFFTIIAGVVSVSNIMLIVVKERTREIGIRKALGAKPWSIIGMIMHEAIFVTSIAGFTGLIFSMGLLEFVGPHVKVDYILNPSVNFNVALSTVILLIAAGTLAGFFPAWKAVKIQVIEALRDE